MKDIISKLKSSKDNIPKRMIVEGHKTFGREKVANCFNVTSRNCAKIASIVPEWQTKLDQYLNPKQIFLV